ncbi:MAG: AmmeMemoRadiSam system protein B, partial [Candidatus Schekmanbacteria bacterium RBG_16_38_10]
MISVKVVGLFILSFLLIPIACSRGATSNQQKIQEPVISGSWYTADKEELKKEINLFLDSTEPEKIDGDILALIEPHAGYTYSGKGAAFGYKAIKGKNYKRVIILAPSHYAWFNGVAVLDATHYRTPLGLISIDTEVCKKLLQEPYFKTVSEAYKKEHSVEIQLPFLQQSLKDFKLIPLLVGEVEGDEYRKIASSIKKFIDKETLVIASSDFTHYGFNFGYTPFSKNIRENLKKLDGGAVDKILKIDSEGFIKYVDKTGITICGRKPIAILLEILPKNINAKLISYYTSGDLVENYS